MQHCNTVPMKMALEPYLMLDTASAYAGYMAVPPETRRPLGFFAYAPPQLSPQADIFVSVHGVNRNAVSHLIRFRSVADEAGALLVAPIFSRKHFRRFQVLAPSDCDRRPDEMLLELVDRLAALYQVTDRRIKLFGYSGGGQFAHRFSMRHPDRVARLVMAAPGWFTFPDAAVAYPHGVGAGKNASAIDIEKFLSIPTDVIVGDRDVERDKVLNVSRKIDAMQGKNRFERARNWVAAINAEAMRRDLAPNATFHIMPGGVHSLEQNMKCCGLGEFIFEKLFLADPQRVASTRVARK